MMWKKLRTLAFVTSIASIVVLMASCQEPPMDGGSNGEFCEDESDCVEGEVCVFDSAEGGTVCRDGSLFGL
jgi:hypothetical protein